MPNMPLNARALLVICAFLLASCSGSHRLEVDLPEFQQWVKEGFHAPRVVHVELPLSLSARFSLQAPLFALSHSRRYIGWTMPVTIEIHALEQLVEESVEIVLKGQAALRIVADSKTLAWTDVSVTSYESPLKSNVLGRLVTEALVEKIVESLNDQVLFTIPSDSPLTPMLNRGEVNCLIGVDRLLFKV